jgi:hypothetical protein
MIQTDRLGRIYLLNYFLNVEVTHKLNRPQIKNL